MITNFPNQVPRTEILAGISDHDIVFFEFNIAPKKLKQKTRQVPIYKNEKWDIIKSEIKHLMTIYCPITNTYNRKSTLGNIQKQT